MASDPYLLTGSTGFIGGAVLSALRARAVPLRRMVRSPAPESDEQVVGRVEDPAVATLAMQGVSGVIHCAAYVGASPVLQQSVNVDGTRNLLAAANAAGVPQFVYLSTSGVYGGVLGKGLTEGGIRLRPQSPLSRSRAEAENLVLDGGGIIVRPNLVYGAGDRQTITVLLRAMSQLNAWIGEPEALVSAIPVEFLGRLIASLLATDTRPAIYHAALPEPTTMAALLGPIYRSARVELPARRIAPEMAAELHPALSARQFGMISHDNWYDSSKIWASTRTQPPATLITPEAVRYYSRVLRQTVRTPGLDRPRAPSLDGDSIPWVGDP